jgi:hypothetical protein
MRSNDCKFFDDYLEKIAAKKQYTIMGGHPGDGGVFYADSPEEVFALYVADETGDHNVKKIMEEMKKPNNIYVGPHKFEKTKDGVWQIGDYEIKETSEEKFDTKYETMSP